jgi:hypothetical protein
MKKLALVAGAGLMALGSIGSASAQLMPDSGTPGSPFPYAAPHEIRTINGVPCRTVYDYNSQTRVPVACAGQVMGGVAAPLPADDVITTGSIAPAPVGPMMGAPMVASPDPYAAPHEIRTVNGVPCRTILDPYTRDTRIPIACGQ